MMTLYLALAEFVNYVLHLSRLNPDILYIHQDSGIMIVAFSSLISLTTPRESWTPINLSLLMVNLNR